AINTDFSVDDDDTFYVGFHCSGANASGSTVAEACPPGQLVVGVHADGMVQCASPLPAIEAAIRSECHIYLGWRDGCGACTEPPTKFGRVGHDSCDHDN